MRPASPMDATPGPGTADPRRLLGALHAAFAAATARDRSRRALVARLFASLERARRSGPVTHERLPVLRHLDAAVALAERRAAPGADAAAAPDRAGPDTTAALARAVAALAPSLAWYRRRGDAGGDGGRDGGCDRGFRDGHANAHVIGPGGLRESPDGAAVGISLMAPRIRYPDHRHPPEELYLVLSPGHWRHGGSAWFEPGVGGVVHNAPDVVHAMRSGETPLLAVWCLLATPD